MEAPADCARRVRTGQVRVVGSVGYRDEEAEGFAQEEVLVASASLRWSGGGGGGKMRGCNRKQISLSRSSAANGIVCITRAIATIRVPRIETAVTNSLGDAPLYTMLKMSMYAMDSTKLVVQIRPSACAMKAVAGVDRGGQGR